MSVKRKNALVFTIAISPDGPSEPVGDELTFRCLNEVLDLDVQDVIVVYDEKSKKAKRYADKIMAVKGADFRERGKSLRPKSVDDFDTARRWRYGVVEAFQDPGVDNVFIFPSDIKTRITEEQRAGWRQMLMTADPSKLVLGDYYTKDQFKASFDQLIGIPTIKTLFPEALSEISIQEHRMIRTEFLIIGRQVFEAFNKSCFPWGADPTAQIAVSTIKSDDLSVESVKLGMIGDSDKQRTPLEQIRQIVRYTSQLSMDRILRDNLWKYSSDAPSGRGADNGKYQLNKAIELRAVLDALFVETLKAIDEVLVDTSEKLGKIKNPATVKEKLKKDVYRAVYIVAQGEYGEWVRSRWNGSLPSGDPLHTVKFDELGEVTAWGDLPHWTTTDALTTFDPESFAQVVRDIARSYGPLDIIPTELDIFGDTALVVKCESPGRRQFDQLRTEIIKATRDLIWRASISDEEFQRAEWRIRQMGRNVYENLKSLFGARDLYLEAGSPILPTSRHFRLGYLVRLYKEWERALEADRDQKRQNLEYFLRNGEPYWYAKPESLHTTIASGLRIMDEAHKTRSLEEFRQNLWKPIQEKLNVYRVDHLAILGEDPDKMIEVRFYDWFTEDFVKEKRPAFKIIEILSLKT